MCEPQVQKALRLCSLPLLCLRSEVPHTGERRRCPTMHRAEEQLSVRTVELNNAGWLRMSECCARHYAPLIPRHMRMGGLVAQRAEGWAPSVGRSAAFPPLLLLALLMTPCKLRAALGSSPRRFGCGKGCSAVSPAEDQVIGRFCCLQAERSVPLRTEHQELELC